MGPPFTRDLIVIGGSLGSGQVIRRLLSQLPADLPAAILIATHMAKDGPNHLVTSLAALSALPVRQAVDGQPVRIGEVTVAAPDRHMMLMDGTITLGTGPRENMVRPAIDPLFRSAALAHGTRVIGVILTGLLNDGAAGLVAVKAMGGLAVVQHPLDAEADAMPLAALEAVEVDHVVRAEELAKLLATLAGSPTSPPGDPTDLDLELEVAIAAGRRVGSEGLRTIAEPSALSCPHCHGVLSQVRGGKPLRYRCQIGHAFTAETVFASQDSGVRDALRLAMRMMEERTELVTRMAQDARKSGRVAVAELYESRAEEYRGYAATLRRAATADLRMSKPTSPVDEGEF